MAKNQILTDSDSDDDTPLVARSNGTRSRAAKANGNGKRPHTSDEELSDEDVPLAKRAKPTNGASAKPSSSGSAAASTSTTSRLLKEEDSSDDEPLASQASDTRHIVSPEKIKDESDSDDDVPLYQASANGAGKKSAAKPKANGKAAAASDSDSKPAKTKVPRKRVKKEEDSDADAKPLKKARTPRKKVKVEEDDDSDDDKPLAKSLAAKADSKAAKGDSKGKGKAKTKKEAEEAEEEEMFKWWEANMLGDGTQKWQTLEHSGVLFPPPYVPLPSDVKMLYNGKPATLPPESEEVAGFFGAMLETTHAQDQTFCNNFFSDWLKILKKYPPAGGVKITEFGKCDFRPMYEHFAAEIARRKSMPAAEKKALKAEKDAAEEKYTFCLLDGRKEKVGNFRAEPPGLFRGRGDHPRRGALKFRIGPEDIILNIGKEAKIPVPNIPGEWKKVVHDNTVTWLANWKENINGSFKYVFLAAGSSLKGQSDMNKFEKARELKKHVDKIRKDYNADLKSKLSADRQRATAMYFIDRLALRAGNEKGDDEADTVGCCSLRYEHITLQPPDELVFDFLGKDSIRYYNVVKVEPQIFKNIRIFKGPPKETGDAIFDRVTTTTLNKHLASYMKGLTAKVFRTYNASITFQEQLDKCTPKDGTVAEKLAAYNQANRMVAILCNHQKSVSKNHGTAMENMAQKIRALKYQRMKLRHGLFALDPKLKKKRKNLAEDESDIDDEWIVKYEDETRAKEIEKAQKKWEKDNEKLEAEGKDTLDESVVEAKISKINDEYDRLKEERGTGQAEVKGKKTEENILTNIAKLDERIHTMKIQMVDREEGKEVALGTSKINYLDPRITQAWCKTHNVPIEKLFSKTLMVKFPWAMEVDGEWKF
ncbi:hypothetical protein BOTBODRAFT_50413 [Botryobasidium botryosum FD-172 SS1]|uniref:DNA topoisomerase I n=1 Tax=Botryobasidium botryosum (strain FD-172 SS1) TaxID=930990 RepID=A0A067N4K3_BOTB1|nr:hypothetical protein BOTBODRAFT_50413 [Botryobasidium botryosum FD-172 SS1]